MANKRRRRNNQYEANATVFMRTLRLVFYFLILSFILVGYKLHTDGVLLDRLIAVGTSIISGLETTFKGIMTYLGTHPKEALVGLFLLTAVFFMGYITGKRR